LHSFFLKRNGFSPPETSEANAAGVAAVSGVGATNLAAEEGALSDVGSPSSLDDFMENLTKMDDTY